MTDPQNTSDSSVKTAEVKAGFSFVSWLGKSIVPIFIGVIIGFFIGNNTLHFNIGLDGCFKTNVSNSSATGNVKTDSIIHGVVITDSTNFDSIVKHRADSLNNIKP